MSIDRRSFLQTSGGLLVGFVLPLKAQLPVEQEPPYPGLFGPFPAMALQTPEGKPNAYIQIRSDETVTLMITRAEMGQGVFTACSQLLAEELDCDWTKVRPQFAPVDTALYGYQGTVGSLSIRTTWGPLRRAGAAAREMLIAAAAQKWGVEPSQCRAENGFVINAVSQARFSYGKLADTASKLAVPANPQLKGPKDYRVIGKPLKRLDTPHKINGSAEFGMDVRLPGMLYAAIARCPVFGGKSVSFDDVKARALPGVKDVLKIATGIAVVADSSWIALQGCRALGIEWDEGPGASVNSDAISNLFAERAKEAGTVARKNGDVEAGLANASKQIEAAYEVPFLAHATMEPMNCTAHVRSNACEVWAPTQSMTDSRDMAAKIAGVPPEKVHFHTTYLGGGFGRRGAFELDFIGEAVELSKRVNAPVRVVWSREDDTQHDFYRPASRVEFAGGLDADGWPIAFRAKISCPVFAFPFTAFAGLIDLQYSIRDLLVDYRAANTTVPVSFWRAPGANQNTFFAESFLDELAAGGGKDPVEVRRRLLTNSPRLLAVLDLAAHKARWGSPLPEGRFQGVALGNNVGSFNAQVAEVSVTGGRVHVNRVVCAFDCGQQVNPAILRQQVHGAIAYGLGAALKGAITIQGGRVQQSNFNTYDVLRIDEMPEIDVHLVSSTESPGGAGEACVPAIAPAVTNAVFAATGKRIRKLPISSANLI